MLREKILRIPNFFLFCKIHTYLTTSIKQYLSYKRSKILMSKIIRKYFSLNFFKLLNNELCSIMSPMNKLWIFLNYVKFTSIISISLSINSQFFYFIFYGCVGYIYYFLSIITSLLKLTKNFSI